MIYGISENPWPTGKCVKYTHAAWGLKIKRVSLLTIIYLLQVQDQGICIAYLRFINQIHCDFLFL